MSTARNAFLPSPPLPSQKVVALTFDGDDVALLDALGAGHPGARAALFDRYAGDVERVLRRVLGADGEIADLIQDVFLVALENHHKVRDGTKLRPWLLSVAVFTARRRIRSRSRRRWLSFRPPEEVPEMESHDGDPDHKASLLAAWKIICTLSADDRIAFTLRVIDGMPLADIAEVVGASLATVKRRVARGEAHFLESATREPALVSWVKRGARWRIQ